MSIKNKPILKSAMLGIATIILLSGCGKASSLVTPVALTTDDKAALTTLAEGMTTTLSTKFFLIL